MNVPKELAEMITTAKGKRFAIGIIGEPYTDAPTVAKSLVEELHIRGRKAECVDVDDVYYVEMMPGIRMRRSNLGRDIEEFKSGTRIYLAGTGQIGADTTVLIALGTYKYLSEDTAALQALDFRLVVSFENDQARLRRKIDYETRPQAEGGLGRSEAEVVGEFAMEQIQGLGARDLLLQADAIWLQDANKVVRWRSH